MKIPGIWGEIQTIKAIKIITKIVFMAEALRFLFLSLAMGSGRAIEISWLAFLHEWWRIWTMPQSPSAEHSVEELMR